MHDFPTLRTPRLLLREIVAADAPALYGIHAHYKFMPWYGGVPLSDQREAERLIETFAGWRRLPDPGTRWGMQLEGRGELIGTCGLSSWHRAWKTCSLDFELAPAWRGKGLMREALAATLDWGFREMALNRVETRVHHLNLAPVRLLRAMGFEQEGCQREAGYWDGTFHDLLQFALLRRDHERLAR